MQIEEKDTVCKTYTNHSVLYANVEPNCLMLSTMYNIRWIFGFGQYSKGVTLIVPVPKSNS